MKPIYITILVVFFAAAALFGSNTVLAASQSEGAISQSRDLCGGTGGNGEIVNVESNTFTLKLNEGGQKGGGNLIVNLADNAKIETSTGFASLSDLKTGDRVTLVGDNNRDGTFTAETVVVCNGIQENATNHTTPIIVRDENPTGYKKVSGVISALTAVLFSSILAISVAFLRLKKKKGLIYLLFFTIFYVYLYKVLDYTLLQFQSLLLLQHFLPNLMLQGQEAGKTINLIPLITLRLEDMKTSLLNILMMIPFGFGLPFITNFRMKKVVIDGLLVSIIIEFLQLITGFIANTTFRVADVNDLIFNTVGVAIGYILFVGFVRNYRHISRNWKISANPILRYIVERPQTRNKKLDGSEI